MHRKDFVSVYSFVVQFKFGSKKKKKIILTSRESNCIFQKNCEFLSTWDVLKLNGIAKTYMILFHLRLKVCYQNNYLFSILIDKKII